MERSVLSILSSISIFLLCFLAVILMTRGNQHHRGARYLGFFLLLNGLNFLGGLLFISDQAIRYPSLVFWTNALPLTFGPLLWLYTKKITGITAPFKRYWLHFLPFILAFILTVVSYHIQPLETKREILALARGPLQKSLPVIISTMVLYAHVALYAFLSIRDVMRYQTSLKDQYSSSQQVNVRWWILLISLYALVLLVAFINSVYGFAGNTQSYELSLIALSFATLLFASFFMYRAISSPFPKAESLPPKYAASPLDETQLDRLETKLDSVMANQKLYRDADLSTDTLAAELHTSGRWLSQLINQRKGMNFYDYVNSQRIEEACRILESSEDKKLTVLEVMFDAGFNSKSSFNTAFKKYKGVTPTEFRNKMRSTS